MHAYVHAAPRLEERYFHLSLSLPTPPLSRARCLARERDMALLLLLLLLSSLPSSSPFFLPPSISNFLPHFPGGGGHRQYLPPGLHSFTHGRGVYKNMAHEFLEAHNAVRAKYGAAPLRWDHKLARYARRWSAQRRFDCVAMHSNSEEYGENIFQGSGWDWRAADAVRSWAEEEAFYDWESNTCQPGEMCGHFTQIVWNDTAAVGCGRVECVAGGVFITCSYDPPGNWQGERPLG